MAAICAALVALAGCARQAPPPRPLRKPPPAPVPVIETEAIPSEPVAPTSPVAVEAPAQREGRIGLLLPLTGRRSELGRQAVGAARLAVGDDPIELFVRDTAGDPFRAVTAAKELIDTDSVACIVGPLLSEVAVGAAAVAEALALPLISPTAPDRRVAALGRNIFQLNVSNEAQGRRMARIAADLFHCRKVAIVHANTAYGETVAAAFRMLFEAGGGQVLGAESYPAAAPQFDPIALRVKELHPDGVFMPMPAAHVARLAPLLLFRDVHAVLLGANGWLADETLELGDQYVGGAVFTAPFNEHSTDPATRDFVRRCKEASGEPPGLVAAYAYDCVRMLVHLRRQGALTPAQVTERLLAGLDFIGTTGAILFDGEGRSVAEPRAVSLHQGEVFPVEISPPPVVAAASVAWLPPLP